VFPPAFRHLTRATIVGGLCALAFAGWLVTRRVDADDGHLPRSVTVVVSRSAAAVPVPRSFLGLSFEYWSFARDAGLGERPDPLFERMLIPLASGGGPVSLRLGGRSTDTSWVGTRASRPWERTRLAEPLIARLRTVLDATHARAILGLNMAAGEPRLAAATARALERGLGRRRIAAFELGNEPDYYGTIAWYGLHGLLGGAGRLLKVFSRPPSYDAARFESDYARFAAAVRAAVPGAPIAGPGYGSLRWMPELGSFIARERPTLALVTYHRYPLKDCGESTGSAQAPTTAHLLADSSSRGLAASLQPAIADARAQGLRVRITELNSVACRGEAGLSNRLPAAVWGLDALFEMVDAGVAGVDIHTRSLSSYSPLYFSRANGHWAVRATPLYYALLLFARLDGRGARVARVATPTPAIKVWRITGAGPERLVVIDKLLGRGAEVRLDLPRGEWPVSGYWLTLAGSRPSGALALGGRTFGLRSRDGRLHGRARVVRQLPYDDGAYVVRFARPGAAVVTLQRSSGSPAKT
jgi:hypothetical protein